MESNTGGRLVTGGTANAGVLITTGATPFHFGTNGAINMTILSGGNVGIGDSNPTVLFEVKEGIASFSYKNQEGYVLQLTDSDGKCQYDPDSGGQVVSCSSDARLKTNIVDAVPVLDYINGIKVRDYTVIASGHQTTGVIAQELLTAGYDELVSQPDGPDGLYMVAELSTWRLVKGIQELDLKLASLSAEFEAQRVGDVGTGAFNLSAIFSGVVDMFKDTYQIVFEQGIIRVAKGFFSQVNTEELCIGSTCVTEVQLKALLDKTNVAPNDNLGPSPRHTRTDARGKCDPGA
ncbi:MAG: hypothetical protein UY36_C0008G0003 [Parcubacteria group bacterium GW2011_GWA1_49_11]|nr:MAG: hypothetical protein UY36_C0008G0003 [Parcubacteria group bacterium GW2011_GWA1_49_11]